VYGALRELIHNTIKHAGARCLTVTCWRRHDSVWVRVADDGTGFAKGFALDGPVTWQGGYGLFAWRDRLGGVCGRLIVRKQGRRGAVVDIEVPRHGQAWPEQEARG
jgi:signal transduction histidine kinase